MTDGKILADLIFQSLETTYLCTQLLKVQFFYKIIIQFILDLMVEIKLYMVLFSTFGTY